MRGAHPRERRGGGGRRIAGRHAAAALSRRRTDLPAGAPVRTTGPRDDAPAGGRGPVGGGPQLDRESAWTRAGPTGRHRSRGRGPQSPELMARRSAGILLYRQSGDEPEVLLVHPGGPFWARKDDGAWSIPKGEYADDEDPRAAALREFEEELGTALPGGDALVDLGEVKQRSGKVVTAYGLEGDLDASDITSNTFEMEWPPRSGKTEEFP